MYPAQMHFNILLGIFVGICIVHVHCTIDSENKENLNAAANKVIVKSACEKGKLQVACPKGQVINIVQATYGRQNNLAKCNPNKNKNFSTKCRSSKSLTAMRQRCHLKRGCSVDATNAVFGDPCPKTIKYLEIRYRCVAEKVTTKITNIKKTTPRATTVKKVATTKIPPKKVTPQPVTTSKPKETTTKLTTEKPTTRVSTEITAKLTTEKPTPEVSTETIVKLTTQKYTPKVSPETTTKLITESFPTKVSTFEDTTLREITTVENKPLSKHACEHDTLHIECEVGNVIRILSANYGRTSMEVCSQNSLKQWNINCLDPKTKEIMTKMCDGKKSCKVAAGNSVFTDNCGYTLKYLDVNYLCEDENKPLSKHACEHDTLHIECEVGNVIRILSASYGRTSMEVCSQNSLKHWNINCLDHKTKEIMRKMCDGKKSCKVAVENSVFTDNCAYTLKYLEVNYFCEDEITTEPPATTNLDIESSVANTDIPKTTQDLPPSTTLKPLTEVLTTTGTKSPVKTSEIPVTTQRLIVTPSDDDVTTTIETTTENAATATSPTHEATSTHEPTPPVPSTTQEIPILSTSKPRVTAPETSCDEEDLDCIIDDLGKRPDWFICEKDMESYPHPASKKLFIFCLNWEPSVKKCGQGRVFSEKLMTCINP